MSVALDERSPERFVATAVKAGLYSNEPNLRQHLAFLFEGVELAGRRLLDVGGGSGLHSFYAAAVGAAQVVCLEPEARGSSGGMIETFRSLEQAFDFGDRLMLLEQRLQDYQAGDRRFDVILLYNSVNHLDEAACIGLHRDPTARQAYREIFARLAALAEEDATLIICDCSRYNLFPRLGLRNPFMPTVEWEKHQRPALWAELLAGAGFRDPELRWSSFNALGQLGRLLLGNRWAAYALMSHFRLRMQKAG